MKRSGIVLLMTLVLITVLMGIVALVLNMSERLSREGNNVFFQTTSLQIVNDLERHLPALLADVTGAEELDLAMRLPLQLESQKGDFIIKARLASPYSRMNINRLINNEGKINESYATVLRRLFALYPIADEEIFIKLVFDTIDTDLAERGSNTEIALTRPNFKNGLIANSKQFNQILERYIELTKDTTILAIPWDRYIGYDGELMDFNALNPEVLSLILPELLPEKIRSLTLYRTKAYASKEEAAAAEPMLNKVFDDYFFIYRPGTSYNLLCDVHVSENVHDEHLRFQYNLFDKKVQRVEFL
jgi:hypothetical protein